MRLAPALVVERVEDGEGGRALLNGEPRDGAGLGIHQGNGGLQKIRDLLLLARLRLQRDVKREPGHRLLLFKAASHQDHRDSVVAYRLRDSVAQVLLLVSEKGRRRAAAAHRWDHQ